MNKLIEAIKNSNKSDVHKYLFEIGYDSNGDASCIEPPLVEAVYINLMINISKLWPNILLRNKIIISYLLKAGADINLKGKSGWSAYEIADRYNLKGVKETINNIYGITLFNAIECNSLNLVRMSLRLPNININQRLRVNDEEEISALALALVQIKLKIAIELVRANIHVTASDIELIQDTAKYLFIQYQNTSCKGKISKIKKDIVLLYKLLNIIEKKHPINLIVAKPYDTSLISAIKLENYSEALELTLSVRDINLLLPVKKDSALSLAIESEHIGLIYSILDKGVNFRGNLDIIEAALKKLSCLNRPIIHEMIVEFIVKQKDSKTFLNFIRFLELSKNCMERLSENLVYNKMWLFVRALISLDTDIGKIRNKSAPSEVSWHSKQKKEIIYLHDKPGKIDTLTLKP